MDKASTKVRIVFDCSAKKDGVSLNDVIYAGPKLQQELFDVLIHLCRNPIALVCGVKEMYLQVKIKEKDRPMFRILWRDCDDGLIMEKYKNCTRLRLLGDKKANKMENMAEIMFLRGGGGGVKYNAIYITKIMSILLKSARIGFN